MKFTANIRKLFLGKFFEEEDIAELKNIAKSSEEEIIKTALLYGNREGWEADSIQSVQLNYDLNKKMIWRVFFKQRSDDGLPYKGGHLILMIDDETKNLIEKMIGTR